MARLLRGYSLKYLCRIALTVLALIIVLPIASFWLLRTYVKTPITSTTVMSPERAAQTFPHPDIKRHLGDVAVTIPNHFAGFMEYDGEPSWRKGPKGPRPIRSAASKVRSFGYYTRFPDMAGRSSRALFKDSNSYLPSTTPWILVGVSCGEDYPGIGDLDHRLHMYVDHPSPILKYENYERLPQKTFELIVYAAKGINPKSHKAYREHKHARDIYIARTNDGSVGTYITCANRKGGVASCNHDFHLVPDLKAEVSILYRRDRLVEWKAIETAVRKQILGFITHPTEAKKTIP
jgi:hypothetical protein